MLQPKAQPTRYDRLGGIDTIATVIDERLDRVMTDPRLHAKYAGGRGAPPRLAGRAARSW